MTVTCDVQPANICDPRPETCNIDIDADVDVDVEGDADVDIHDYLDDDHYYLRLPIIIITSTY